MAMAVAVYFGAGIAEKIRKLPCFSNLSSLPPKIKERGAEVASLASLAGNGTIISCHCEEDCTSDEAIHLSLRLRSIAILQGLRSLRGDGLLRLRLAMTKWCRSLAMMLLVLFAFGVMGIGEARAADCSTLPEDYAKRRAENKPSEEDKSWEAACTEVQHWIDKGIAGGAGYTIKSLDGTKPPSSDASDEAHKEREKAREESCGDNYVKLQTLYEPIDKDLTKGWFNIKERVWDYVIKNGGVDVKSAWNILTGKSKSSAPEILQKFQAWNTINGAFGSALLLGTQAQNAFSGFLTLGRTCLSYYLADAGVEGYNKCKEDCKKTTGCDALKECGELYEYQSGTTIITFLRKGDRIEAQGTATDQCVPLPFKLFEFKGCLFCPLFELLFNAAAFMLDRAYDTIAPQIGKVMLVGFAIFIAFKVFALVSGFTKQEAPKLITELLGQAFKIVFIWYVLANGNLIYKKFLSPVLEAGIDYGEKVMTDNSGCPEEMQKDMDARGVVFTSKYFPIKTFKRADCFVANVQKELAYPQSIGSSLMCIATHTEAKKGVLLGYPTAKWPNWGMMLQGAIVYVFATLMGFAFAFYLIDATARIGILGALMPFLVATWPFKVTRSYSAKAWQMFMNTVFTYAFMAITVAIAVKLMEASLTSGDGDRELLMQTLNGNNIEVLEKMFALDMTSLLILIAACIIGFKLIGKTSDLAQFMSGVKAEGIGANLGGLAASAAKHAGKQAGKLGMGVAAGAAAPVVGKVFGEDAADAVRQLGGSKGLGKIGVRLGGGASRVVGGVKHLGGAMLGGKKSQAKLKKDFKDLKNSRVVQTFNVMSHLRNLKRLGCNLARNTVGSQAKETWKSAGHAATLHLAKKETWNSIGNGINNFAPVRLVRGTWRAVGGNFIMHHAGALVNSNQREKLKNDWVGVGNFLRNSRIGKTVEWGVGAVKGDYTNFSKGSRFSKLEDEKKERAKTASEADEIDPDDGGGTV